MWRSLLRLKSCRAPFAGPNTEIGAIAKAIESAEFVSVDLELSGLHLRNERFIGVDRCYEAHSEGAKLFVPLQIGVCAARRSEHSATHWILTPSSVFIYPKEDHMFQASSGTFSFLRQNKFDFNKWISNGVGFMKPKEEEEQRKAIYRQMEDIRNLREIERNASKISPSTPTKIQQSHMQLLSSEDRRIIEEVIEKILKWIEEGDEETLEIPIENAFQRLILHRVIAEEYTNVHSLSTRKGNEAYVSIFRSKHHLYDQQLKALEAELCKVDENVGVRAILDKIIEGKTALVGHNCFYDLLHLYQTFYDELPVTVSEFKERWIEKFKVTFDTKYMAEAHELLSPLQPPATLKGLCDFMAFNCWCESEVTFEVECLPNTVWSLPECVDRASKRGSRFASSEGLPFHDVGQSIMKLKEGSTSFEGGSHEAGFDSMMTAIVFILQCSFILKRKKLEWKETFFNEARNGRVASGHSKSLLDLLPMMINHVRLVKTQPNVINLGEREDRDMCRHYYMHEFSHAWSKMDVMRIWAPLNINITAVDDNSCWLVVRNEEEGQVLKRIYDAMKEPKSFKLLSYEEYKYFVKNHYAR